MFGVCSWCRERSRDPTGCVQRVGRVVVCALRAYLLARRGAEAMLGFFGKNEKDGLARLAGILYLLVLPTAGPWYYTSTGLLGADATPEKLEASRGTLELMILLG